MSDVGHYLDQVGDYRLPTALSYLGYLIQRYDELDNLYWEQTDHEKDVVVEDARQFLKGVPRPAQKCSMGPRARLVSKAAWERRPVTCVETQQTFKTVTEAAKALGIDRAVVTKSARFNVAVGKHRFVYEKMR